MASRLRAALALASVLATLSCATSSPAVAVTGLRIGLPLLRALADIQTEFRHETVYCLLGHDEGGIAVIDAMQPAFIKERTRMSVLFDDCPAAAMAWYHNHPAVPGAFNCFPSEPDLAVLHDRHGYRFMLISCALDGVAAPFFVYRMRNDSADSYISPGDYGGASPTVERPDALLPH